MITEETQPDWRWQPLRELACGGLLVMELLLAGFWFAVIARGYKPISLAVIYAILGVIFAGVYLMERTAPTWPIASVWRRVIEIAGLLICLWAALEVIVYFPGLPGLRQALGQLFRGFASEYTIPLEFWVLLTVLLLWGRSLSLAHQPVDADRVISTLLIGMLTLMAYQFFPRRIAERDVFTGIFFFIFLGLLSMATRGWAVGLGASALAAAGLTALLALLFRGTVGQWVIHFFALIFGLLGALFSVILYPVSLLVSYLIIWLQNAMTHILADSPLVNTIKQLAMIFNKVVEDNGDRFQQVTKMVKPATLWLILIVILAGVLLAIGMQAWKEYRRRMDTATTQLSPGDVLREMGEAARQRARELAEEFARRLRSLPGTRLIQALRIRLIYSELMELCTVLRHPRLGATTPLEFLPEMKKLFPDSDADLQTITEAYLRVRYGQLPETREEVEPVLAAWERVKQLGKEALK
jgi:hypothetical protein